MIVNKQCATLSGDIAYNEINMKLTSLLSLKHEDMKQQQLARSLFIWGFPPIRT